MWCATLRESLGAIRVAWAELIDQPVDETLILIPPVYSDHGINLRCDRRRLIRGG
ncbi:hypothetical protein [Kribbella sp. CA-293567]|uniref:hypothetical protein n=1 Tax=Kribbella sp. CA-293567 TaxID=3002436 RepID=UPI0022DE16B3|nr:hypothetical protein [Kribbella sp. CA-293567]WBQ07980.1 hypothetical protein OX958_14520 [Kribbella sp. CA-293567]